MEKANLIKCSQQITKYYIVCIFFVPQSIRIQEPGSCVGFALNGSTYIGITHGGPPFSPAANLSIFKMHKDLNITLVRQCLSTSVINHWKLCWAFCHEIAAFF